MLSVLGKSFDLLSELSKMPECKAHSSRAKAKKANPSVQLVRPVPVDTLSYVESATASSQSQPENTPTAEAPSAVDDSEANAQEQEDEVGYIPVCNSLTLFGGRLTPPGPGRFKRFGKRSKGMVSKETLMNQLQHLLYKMQEWWLVQVEEARKRAFACIQKIYAAEQRLERSVDRRLGLYANLITASEVDTVLNNPCTMQPQDKDPSRASMSLRRH